MSESQLVSIVLDGLQRQLAKPKVQKEPVSGDMITALVNSLGDRPTLTDVGIFSIFAVRRACEAALL